MVTLLCVWLVVYGLVRLDCSLRRIQWIRYHRFAARLFRLSCNIRSIEIRLLGCYSQQCREYVGNSHIVPAG